MPEGNGEPGGPSTPSSLDEDTDAKETQNNTLEENYSGKTLQKIEKVIDEVRKEANEELAEKVRQLFIENEFEVEEMEISKVIARKIEEFSSEVDDPEEIKEFIELFDSEEFQDMTDMYSKAEMVTGKQIPYPTNIDMIEEIAESSKASISEKLINYLVSDDSLAKESEIATRQLSVGRRMMTQSCFLTQNLLGGSEFKHSVGTEDNYTELIEDWIDLFDSNQLTYEELEKIIQPLGQRGKDETFTVLRELFDFYDSETFEKIKSEYGTANAIVSFVNVSTTVKQPEVDNNNEVFKSFIDLAEKNRDVYSENVFSNVAQGVSVVSSGNSRKATPRKAINMGLDLIDIYDSEEFKNVIKKHDDDIGAEITKQISDAYLFSTTRYSKKDSISISKNITYAEEPNSNIAYELIEMIESSTNITNSAFESMPSNLEVGKLTSSDLDKLKEEKADLKKKATCLSLYLKVKDSIDIGSPSTSEEWISEVKQRIKEYPGDLGGFGREKPEELDQL
ncbi:MAG: hypothetical protein ABEI74_01450 [Candidatus Pacearchaeota archaeon]